MAHSRPLYRLFLVFFKQTLQFLQQINVKKCPSSQYTVDRIRTHVFQLMSLFPWPVDHGSRPKYIFVKITFLFFQLKGEIIYIKMIFFKLAQKVTKHLGYFCKKSCRQELSTTAQSGHTIKHFLPMFKCYGE